MIENIIIFLGLIYTIEFAILLLGLKNSNKLKREKIFEPTVTVIVAARNEEKNILACLRSLNLIDYPSEKIEIIIVNDHSSDETENIVNEYIKGKNQFRLLNAPEAKGKLIGKINAIAFGIENSSGEIILMTDADCAIPETWVKETVSYFTEDVGIVAGFTILKAKNNFEGIQTLEWTFLYGIASGAAFHGFPLTAVGNNIAFRRIAYEQVGGYTNIPFSVTEDYILTRNILNKTGYKLKFPLNYNTLIQSLPCPNWKQFFRQKQRWIIGGIDMVAIGYLVFGIPFALTIMLLVNLFLSNEMIWLSILFFKTLVELIFVTYPLRKFRKIAYLKYFPSFAIFYFFYVLFTPLVAVFTKKITWKDRVY